MKQINKIFMNKNIAVILYALAAVGIVFMLLPVGNKAIVKEETEERGDQEDISPKELETRLEQLLGITEGAGKVKVMITYKNNGKIVLAENKQEEASNEDKANKTSTKRDIVFNGENKPVVLSEATPEIEGVVIVAQGGANIEVKNALIRAAEALLGVEPHKIEVLKMKTEA